MRRLAASWSRYWFQPAPLIDLALSRVTIVGFQILNWVSVDPQQRFGMRAAMPDEAYSPIYILQIMVLPLGRDFRPGLDAMMIVHWVSLLFGVLALVGLWTNLSLALFAAGNIFMQAFINSFGDYHHPEALIAIALCALAISPAGRVLSVDAWLQRRAGAARPGNDPWLETSPFALWPLRLVQWLLALMYLNAAWHKLTHPGFKWLNGYTLQYHLMRDAHRWDSDLGVWFGQQHVLAIALSWVSVIFEASFFVVLFVPAAAALYLPLGTLFHVGIYVMMRAPFFQMMVLYVAFVPWSKVLPRLRA